MKLTTTADINIDGGGKINITEVTKTRLNFMRWGEILKAVDSEIQSINEKYEI